MVYNNAYLVPAPIGPVASSDKRPPNRMVRSCRSAVLNWSLWGQTHVGFVRQRALVKHPPSCRVQAAVSVFCSITKSFGSENTNNHVFLCFWPQSRGHGIPTLLETRRLVGSESSIDFPQKLRYCICG